MSQKVRLERLIQTIFNGKCAREKRELIEKSKQILMNIDEHQCLLWGQNGMLLRSVFCTASLNISVKCSKAEHEANVPLGNGEVIEKLNNENNPTSTWCQQSLKHEFWLCSVIFTHK